AQLLLVGEGDIGGFDATAPLYVDGAGPVDHHLLDGGVGEQHLERAEADAVADDPGRDLLTVALPEQNRLPLDQGAHRLAQISTVLSARRRGSAPLDKQAPQRRRKRR